MAHIKRIIEIELIAQTERIERLEQVILAMAKGTESSPPHDGPGHTHWTYPLNKVQGLVEEIKKGAIE